MTTSKAVADAERYFGRRTSAIFETKDFFLILEFFHWMGGGGGLLEIFQVDDLFLGDKCHCTSSAQKNA